MSLLTRMLIRVEGDLSSADALRRGRCVLRRCPAAWPKDRCLNHRNAAEPAKAGHRAVRRKRRSGNSPALVRSILYSGSQQPA